MQYLLNDSPAEVVAAGAQLLDERMPGWWKKVSLEELQLSSCESCVCGQLAGTALVKAAVANDFDVYEDLNSFAQTTAFLNLASSGRDDCPSEVGYDYEFGFNVMDWDGETPVDQWCSLVDGTYAALEAEWKLVIQARLEADKLEIATRWREAFNPSEKVHSLA